MIKLLPLVLLLTGCSKSDLPDEPADTDETVDTDVPDTDTDTDTVTDPESDSDGDEQCYACGWEHNADESWSSEGSEVGDTIANVELLDTCGEAVDLWDLAGEYHILYLTGAW